MIYGNRKRALYVILSLVVALVIGALVSYLFGDSDTNHLAFNLNEGLDRTLSVIRYARIVVISVIGLFFWLTFCRVFGRIMRIDPMYFYPLQYRVLIWYWVFEAAFFISMI